MKYRENRARRGSGSALGFAALATGLVIAGAGWGRAAGQPPSRARLQASLDRLPLAFEENQGQADRQFGYVARTGGGGSLLLTPDAAVIGLRGRSGARGTLHARFEGANPGARLEALERLPGIVSYFKGRDPKGWHAGIPTFARIRSRDVYPETDVEYYGDASRLEYDFNLRPGADPERIRLSFDGARSVRVDPDGTLAVETEAGELRERAPVAYQDRNGKRVAVECSYVLATGDGRRSPVAARPSTVRLAVGPYDRTMPLVIDPVLIYASFLGGSGVDSGAAIALDTDGNPVVAGYTSSADFPSNPRRAVGVSDDDAFVTKFNAAGTAVLYSVYYGGGGGDAANGVAVDGSGNAYIAGTTFSDNIPVTPGAYKTTFVNPPGNTAQSFVAKIGANGTSLVYGTYFLSDPGATVFALAVDRQGNACITGASAEGMPITAGAAQTKYGGFNSDAFAAKLNAAGSDLVFCTYLGGNDNETGFAIATDAAGNVYVGGNTKSPDYPVTAGAVQPGNGAGFVTKLNPTGTQFVYSTHVAGTGEFDSVNGLAVDAAGKAYVAGYTDGGPLFVAVNALYPTSRGNTDAFIGALNPTGSAYVFMTYYGGSAVDVAQALALDEDGCVHVAGYTRSADFSLVKAFQTQFKGVNDVNGFGGDAFFVRLDPTGQFVLASTYLGGNANEAARGVAADTHGNAFVTGETASADFPASVNAFQPQIALAPNQSPSVDAFIAKIFTPPPATPAQATAVLVGPRAIDVSWKDMSDDETGFRIERKAVGDAVFLEVGTMPAVGGTGSTVIFHDVNVPCPNTTYIYRVRASGWCEWSDYSNDTPGVTTAAQTPPSGIMAVAVGAHAINVTFTDNTVDETGFRIERRLASDPVSAYQEVGTAPLANGTGSTVTFQDRTGLAANTRYTYRARAADACSRFSDYSGEASATTPPEPPAVPTNVGVTVIGSRALDVTFTDASTDETGFEIERRLTSASVSTYARVGTLPATGGSGTVLTFHDTTGLSPNTSYTYRVRAAATGGFFSDYSTEATGVTKAEAPAAKLAKFGFIPSVAKGGQTLKVVLQLTAPAPAGGAKVTFKSSNRKFPPPAPVTIPAGKIAPTKTIGYKTKKVTSTVRYSVSATYGGVTKTTTVGLKK